MRAEIFVSFSFWGSLLALSRSVQILFRRLKEKSFNQLPLSSQRSRRNTSQDIHAVHSPSSRAKLATIIRLLL